MKRSFVMVCALALLTVAGCAGVPVETLRAYSDAFQQARSAGDLLLDEISPIVSSAGTGTAKTCGTSRLGYPQCFDPAVALGDDGTRRNEDPSIRARRDALAVVTLYNSLLVDLAEGKSAAQFNERLDELVTLVNAVAAIGVVPSGGLTALVPPSATFAKDMYGRLSRARANAAVRQAILDSKTDVQEMLDALLEDTPNIYKVFLRARERDLIVANHEANAARLNEDATARAAALKRVDAIRQSISDFHDSLTAYAQLLNSTSKALDTLVAAAGQQPGTVESLTRIAIEAAEIREKSDAFWAEIRDVRSGAAVAGR
ncbi:hypothetical protein [Roseibium sp.]|uniref:hypothetical protein n=1 Tax=Roseibium sp. TaxID=1936156 RepID=UPI003A986BFB